VLTKSLNICAFRLDTIPLYVTDGQKCYVKIAPCMLAHAVTRDGTGHYMDLTVNLANVN